MDAAASDKEANAEKMETNITRESAVAINFFIVCSSLTIIYKVFSDGYYTHYHSMIIINCRKIFVKAKRRKNGLYGA